MRTSPVPWRPPRPPTVWHGYYVIQPPLPATARIAVVQFGGQDLGGVVETVRVPLDLRALALRRIVHPGTRVRASGLTLTLRDLAVAHLTYTLPPDIPIDRAHVHLVDGTGRIVPTTPFEPDCTDGTWWTCSRTGSVFGKEYIPARVNLDIKIVESYRL